jgi:meso-butanediol dehydrogenase / (S,S)-butanediol dehydrogenase / diacetyl reductase
MGLLSRHVVIVTGAAGGIGRGITVALASQGATVIAADVNPDGLAETQRAAAGGGEVTTQIADVSQEPDVRSLVATATERYGRLTGIVNNAGISIPNAVADTTVEEFERTMAVNVRGPFLGCKYAVPALLEGGGGSIVNVGSINSLVAEPQLTAYCTSKGAVLMLTKSVALDYAARGIRCNCICPGFVDTAINGPHFDRLAELGLDEDLPAFQPIGRPIEPSEIGEVAAFLISDASSAMTGIAIPVDGGITAKA